MLQQQKKRFFVTANCSYNHDLQFEWDESKRISNIRKHGIDFLDVSTAFNGSIVTVADNRFDYAEERFITFGSLQGRVIVIVHTESEDCIRVISVRKATKHEQKTYFKQI